jgi:hypothetical protein
MPVEKIEVYASHVESVEIVAGLKVFYKTTLETTAMSYGDTSAAVKEVIVMDSSDGWRFRRYNLVGVAGKMATFGGKAETEVMTKLSFKLMDIQDRRVGDRGE